jgi:quercetin dioxygenase-like cupin family protein
MPLAALQCETLKADFATPSSERDDVSSALLLLRPGTAGHHECVGKWPRARFVPGSGVPPHTHTHEDEAFYVLAGEIILDSADRPHRCGLVLNT